MDKLYHIYMFWDILAGEIILAIFIIMLVASIIIMGYFSSKFIYNRICIYLYESCGTVGMSKM